jgi:hypothetical protein
MNKQYILEGHRHTFYYFSAALEKSLINFAKHIGARRMDEYRMNQEFSKCANFFYVFEFYLMTQSLGLIKVL